MEEEQNAARISKLEEEVVKLIQEEKGLEDQLQLIDHLQQLGVAYHFKDDIKDALGSIHGSLEDTSMLLKDNLHATALLFRLLRENGFDVSEGSSPHLHYACLIKSSRVLIMTRKVLLQLIFLLKFSRLMMVTRYIKYIHNLFISTRSYIYIYIYSRGMQPNQDEMGIFFSLSNRCILTNMLLYVLRV